MKAQQNLYQYFELEGTGVRVTVVCPGWVRTNISQAVRNLPEQYHYELTPEQAAEMAEYKAHRKTVVRSGAIEPDELAEQVRDAVLAKQFYVFTLDDAIEDARNHARGSARPLRRSLRGAHGDP